MCCNESIVETCFVCDLVVNEGVSHRHMCHEAKANFLWGYCSQGAVVVTTTMIQPGWLCLSCNFKMDRQLSLMSSVDKEYSM